MPTLNNSIHYVKFLRGSISAWNQLLQTPSKIDDDTLYFIYENSQNTLEGKLYLGRKLISGTGDEISNINLANIGDIYIDDQTLENKQILVYNETTDKWENASIEDIINTDIGVMVGASAAANGAAGLVPMPHAGDQKKFLRGDGQWTTITVPTFNQEVFTLNNNELTLKNYQFAPIGSVPIKTENDINWVSLPTGQLDRQITTLEKLRAQINGTDPNPVSEHTIYMILNGNSDDSGDKYDEYMVINNRIERLGTFGQVNLTNYVTVTTFETEINKLEDILYDHEDEHTEENVPGLISRVNNIELNFVSKADIGDLSQLLLHEGNSNLVEEINSMNVSISNLDERLKWKELDEE